MDIKAYTHKLFLRQLIVGAVLATGYGFYSRTIPWSLLWGLLIGWSDNLLVLRGINKGMEKAMPAAAGQMHGMLFPRLGLLLTAVVLGLYLGFTAYSIFGAYVFLHVSLLVNMVFLAQKNTK